ncbi:Amyloid protein-binding protein 2 [Portunus trituberculatus]|uniref:Amyloid protein-binding protein 2 n=1 Tax=Portunus trituberculatus TaxID=210409 RepID=A0A5B7FJQ0_PORTR|nr:Amyloid protein-binding protein 2 [Portunus trituberculatus]
MWHLSLQLRVTYYHAAGWGVEIPTELLFFIVSLRVWKSTVRIQKTILSVNKATENICWLPEGNDHEKKKHINTDFRLTAVPEVRADLTHRETQQTTMASASVLKWFPEALYYSALNVVVHHYKNIRHELRIFPPSVQFDILFKALMDQALGHHSTKISSVISQAYVDRCNQEALTDKQRDSLVLHGLAISAFLAEAGWLPDAEVILTSCQNLLADSSDPLQKTRALECCHRLLHVQNGYCRFEEAEHTYNQAMVLVKQLQGMGASPNLASLYSEFSTLYMLRSNYAEAYSWSVKALQSLVANFPKPPLIDVLRQSAKACVLKREFKKARLLIRQVCYLSSFTEDLNFIEYSC